MNPLDVLVHFEILVDVMKCCRSARTLLINGTASEMPGRHHYPVCWLDIRQDSEFATGYRYPKTAFKRKPDPDIRNAFGDISRFHAFGKSCTLHNRSFIIFRRTFSAFCAMTLSLSMVQSLYLCLIPFPS